MLLLLSSEKEGGRLSITKGNRETLEALKVSHEAVGAICRITEESATDSLDRNLRDHWVDNGTAIIIREKTPEECLENCKIQRDTKLSLNKVEIRPNEFVNARLEDKVNLESIYKSLQEGELYEFYNGGYFIWLTKEEIYEVLLRGQQQMEAIWDEFKAQVKAI